MEGFTKPTANNVETMSQTKAEKIKSINAQLDRLQGLSHDPEILKTINSLQLRLAEVNTEPNDIIETSPEIDFTNDHPINPEEML
jgi:hypothetical protein